MDENITRKNHYVPQMYLEGWATNNNVWRYELIVPDERSPLWKCKSIEYTGVQTDFYTRRSNGVDDDEWEKWFGSFETKAAEPLRKARKGRHLDAADWSALIGFVGIQCLRTPTAVARSLPLIRDGISNGLDEATKVLSSPDAKEIISNSPKSDISNDMIPASITIDREAGMVHTSVIVGKSTSLLAMKMAMNGLPREVLHQNKWGIITCDERTSWPTSDNPVILLNYYPDESYDFKGGWGNKNTEIIMPVSPQKAIYTRVKSKSSPRIHCNLALSSFIRKIIVENSYRYVFNNCEDQDIPTIRRRTVNKTLFLEVNRQMEKMHQSYLENEVPLMDKRQSSSKKEDSQQ